MKGYSMVFHDELFYIELYETHFGRVVEFVILSARENMAGHHLAEPQPLSTNMFF